MMFVSLTYETINNKEQIYLQFKKLLIIKQPVTLLLPHSISYISLSLYLQKCDAAPPVGQFIVHGKLQHSGILMIQLPSIDGYLTKDI